MEGIGIGLFIPLINTVTQSFEFESIDNFFIRTLNGLFERIPADRRLITIIVLIFIFICTKALLFYIYRILFEWYISRFGHRLRSRIFDQVLRVNFRYLENNHYGNLFNILTTETWRTGNALSTFISLIILSINISVYFILLLIISIKMTIIVVGVMAFISMITKLVTSRVKELGKIATVSNSKFANLIIECVAGMKVIRVFCRENFELKRFEKSSDHLSNTFVKLGMFSNVINPIYEILAALLLCTIMLIALKNQSNLSSILVFIFILYRLQPKIKTFDSYRVGIKSLAPAVEETASVLDIAETPNLNVPLLKYKGIQLGIVFENTTFFYSPNEKPIFRDLSMTIPAGKTTAIIGPSGAGKTTLTKLLLRLYDPCDGRILIDKTPLTDINLVQWRQSVAFVSQDVFLFNTSIYDNIAYGSERAVKEDVVTASKLADAHYFIMNLPEGYASKVGDRGVRLSGGQQQRIALARALVRNPDVLILDEATNALDGISIQLINKALLSVTKNRTVIVIAHRFTSLAGVDHIIVLQEGCVVEQGSPQALLSNGGLFARLYELESQENITQKQ